MKVKHIIHKDKFSFRDEIISFLSSKHPYYIFELEFVEYDANEYLYLTNKFNGIRKLVTIMSTELIDILSDMGRCSSFDDLIGVINNATVDTINNI